MARGVKFVRPSVTDARDRRASVDRPNARGKTAIAGATRGTSARRSRRRVRRRRTPRVARAGDGRRAVFSDASFLERVSRSDALARAPGRSEPPPDETSSLHHASDRFSRLFRGPRRRRLSNAFGRPSAARGSPAPDGRDDVHLQEGCARASREGGAQGERVRPRHRGGRGRSRHRRDRGQRAVRQVQEKRACPRRNPRTRRSNPTRARGLRSRRRPKRLRRPFSSIVASRPPRVPASPNAARALPPRARATTRAPRVAIGWKLRLARAATGPGDAA